VVSQRQISASVRQLTLVDRSRGDAETTISARIAAAHALREQSL